MEDVIDKKPKFNPNKEYTPVEETVESTTPPSQEKPKFDASKPYEAVKKKESSESVSSSGSVDPSTPSGKNTPGIQLSEEQKRILAENTKPKTKQDLIAEDFNKSQKKNQQKEAREFVTGEKESQDILSSFTKTIQSGVADQLPKEYYTQRLRMSKGSFGDLYDSRSDLNAYGGDKFQEQLPAGTSIGAFKEWSLKQPSAIKSKTIDERAKIFLTEKLGEKGFEELKSKFAVDNLKERLGFEKNIEEQNLEAGQAMEGVVQDLKSVSSASDFLSFTGNMIGQALYRAPISIGTGSAGSIISESAAVYDRQIDLIAQRDGISREDVIKKGLDKPAEGQAMAVLAGTLDAASEFNLIGLFRKAVAKELTQNVVKQFAKGFVRGGAPEALTEVAQGELEEMAAAKGANVEYTPDAWRMATSAVGGLIGGGILGGAVSLTTQQQARPTGEFVAEQIDTVKDTDNIPIIEHAADAIDAKVQAADENIITQEPTKEEEIVQHGISDVPPIIKEEDAVQERSTEEVLSSEPGGTGSEGGERGGVEPVQQGESPAAESVQEEAQVEEEKGNENPEQQSIDTKGNREEITNIEKQITDLYQKYRGATEKPQEVVDLETQLKELKAGQNIPVESVFKLPKAKKPMADDYKSPFIEKEIDVNEIAPSQDNITKDYVENKDEKYIPTVIKVGDKYVVEDGHHRIGYAINEGKGTVKVKVRYTDKSEYDAEKNAGTNKKTLLNRAYQGTTDEKVKSSIEKHGLNYEVESHASADKAANNFIKDVGIDKAVDAVRRNEVDDGAAAFIWAKAIDDVGEKIASAKSTEEIKELTDMQSSLIDEFDKKARSGGRFISALQEVYRSSDFGYKADYQVKKYKEVNNGKISPEVEAKFKDLDKKLQDANDKIKKLEESKSKLSAKESLQGIRQDLQAQKEKRAKVAKERKDKIDNFFDSLKVKNDPNKLNSITQVIGEAVWNGSVEVMRKAVMAGADVATAIQSGIDYINEHYRGDDFNEEEFIKLVQPGIERIVPSVEGDTIKKPAMKDGKLTIPNSLIRQLVEAGAEDIDELTQSVHDLIKNDLPDVSLREVRDAITKYGETRTLSQDDVNVKIRELRRVGKLVSALEDVQNKLRPLRSGLQRDKLTDQERRMQREIKEAIKDFPVDQDEVDQAWKNSLDAVKSRLKNQIADLEDQIKSGAKTPVKKGIEYDAEANTLKDQRDSLKKILQETEGKQSLSDEQKTRNAVAAVQKTIDEYERRIAEKDFSTKEKSKTKETQELKSLRGTRDKLKETYKQLEKDLGIADKKRLENVKKSIKKATSRYEERLKNKDFAPAAKKAPLPFDKELNELKLDRDKIKAEFDVEQEKARMANRPMSEKIWDTAVDVWNLPKSLLASIDMSAPFRQGAVLSISNPKAGVKSFHEMFRQAFSEKKADEWLLKLRDTPEYQLMKQSKLYLAEPNTKLTAKEEQFLSNFAGRIPIIGRLIKGSERAYTGYLNKLRVDVFANGVDRLMEQGITPESNPEAYKAWASFINNATGRGNLGALENAATVLNGFFFSPRYLASRVNLLNPVTYSKMPKAVRVMALKSMITYAAFGALFLSLAAAAGADVEHDPRSSDFGKMKIGNMRYDIWAGFQQVIRFIAQVTTGERKSTKTGKITKLDGKTFPFESRGDVVKRFFRSKLSPAAGTTVNMLTGEDMMGNEVTIEGEALKSVIPLYLQDVNAIYQAEGPTGLAESMIPSFFGIGVQNYEAKKK
jgi:DNA repair exonuclease SbcCD ATPase subunit